MKIKMIANDLWMARQMADNWEYGHADDQLAFVKRTVEDSEVTMAIEDFFRENKIVTSPSWWEVFFFQKLADDYIKDRKLTFTN